MEQVNDETRRRELAEFLRSRRERLSPEEAGLPSGRRRRTPGLRREEVAELAGIGTTWYTWLEQARDIKPSEGALREIAQALRLDTTERRYFLELASERAPRQRRQEIVTPTLQSLLESISGPAYVKGQRWDLLAYNEIANVLFDFEHLSDRNLLRRVFSLGTRHCMPNWEQMGRQQVAMFRADCAGLLKDPWISELVDDLKERYPEFRSWWAEQAVSEMRGGHKTFEHPEAGQLSFEFTVLQAADSPNLKLVAYVPDDDGTPERLAQYLERKRKDQH